MAGVKVSIDGDNVGLRRAFDSARRDAKKFQKDLGAVTRNVGGFVGVAGLTMASQQAINAGSRFSDLATQIQTTSEEAQVLDKILRDAGASQNDLANGVTRMIRSTEEAKDGMASYADAFEKLGIKAEDFDGKTQAEKLAMLGRAYLDTGRSASSYAAIIDILGRSGRNLIEVIERLANGDYETIRDEMDKTGKLMSSKTVQDMDEAADAMENFQIRATAALAFVLSKFKEFGEASGRGMAKFWNSLKGEDIWVEPTEKGQKFYDNIKGEAAGSRDWLNEVYSSDDAQSIEDQLNRRIEMIQKGWEAHVNKGGEWTGDDTLKSQGYEEALGIYKTTLRSLNKDREGLISSNLERRELETREANQAEQSRLLETAQRVQQAINAGTEKGEFALASPIEQLQKLRGDQVAMSEQILSGDLSEEEAAKQIKALEKLTEQIVKLQDRADKALTSDMEQMWSDIYGDSGGASKSDPRDRIGSDHMPAVDSLVAVGGGRARVPSALNQLQKDQLEVMKRIEQNTADYMAGAVIEGPKPIGLLGDF